VVWRNVSLIILIITSLVVPDITQAPVDSASMIGDMVTFTCIATGVPLPDITWSSDSNSNIMDQLDDVMINDTFDGTMRRSELTLTNLQAVDFQNYTCNATNQFGSDSETVLLGSELMLRILALLHE